MSKIVIIKNNTSNDLVYDGIPIVIGGSVTLDELIYINKLAYEDEFTDDIVNGNVIINDGTSDLSVVDAIAYIRSWNDNTVIYSVPSEIRIAFLSQHVTDYHSYDDDNISNQDYMSSKSSRWKVMTSFDFPGTNRYGMPSSLRIIASRKGSSGSATLRVWDYSNRKQVATVSWTNRKKQVYETLSFTNLPNVSAIFEVQMKHSGSQGRIHELILSRS